MFFSKEARLQRAIIRLKDAVWYREKWGFSDSPSERAADLRKIEKRARKVDELGGDSTHLIPSKILDDIRELNDMWCKHV